MAKTAIVTDSNSGITQEQAKELGVYVLPMPFLINGDEYYEDINLTQEHFYEKLTGNADVSTSQPAVGAVLEMWDKVLSLDEYDSIIHIPMSSGLSGACQTAKMLAEDYDGKVIVVDNQRISVTMRQSVLEAKALADAGKSAEEIEKFLMDTKMESIIYIMVNDLKYLKKGGRVTPAGAALATILGIKPVLVIYGEKLDAFSKARSIKNAKRTMIDAVKKFMEQNYPEAVAQGKLHLQIAYSDDRVPAEEFKKDVEAAFPGMDIYIDCLSLSVACHIGPGALALAATIDYGV